MINLDLKFLLGKSKNNEASADIKRTQRARGSCCRSPLVHFISILIAQLLLLILTSKFHNNLSYLSNLGGLREFRDIREI